MQSFPHRYTVSARGRAEGEVLLESARLAALASAAPSEFGGPGDRWSPETLLVGAVADCYVLSLRAVAAASKLSFSAVECRAEGILDRVDRVTRFTRIDLRVVLDLPADEDPERAERVLAKAKSACLISNSLACPVELEATIRRG